MSKKSVWTPDEEADFEAWKLTVGEPNSPETEEWLSFGDAGFLDLDESEFRTENLH